MPGSLDPIAPRPAESGDSLHLMLQPLLPWWRGLPAAEKGLPLWHGDLVFDLKPWMGHMLMVRFPAGGAPPRYTLYGSELVSFSGHDLTGRDIQSGSNPGFREASKAYLQCHAARRPHWGRLRVDLPHGLKVRYDRLLLPFTCADGDDRVLGIIRFDFNLPRNWRREDFALAVEQERLLP